MNMTQRKTVLLSILLLFPVLCVLQAQSAPTPQQLEGWLKRFPKADTNKDGKLTVEEALAYRKKAQGGNKKSGRGSSRDFTADPGWDAERFPEHAVSYKTPEEIAAIYAEVIKGKGNPVTSYPKPDNGALRIVGTGHSFMVPGYRTLPKITQADGFTQPILTHIGGGVTGSTRYKWEQENGIFQFDQRPAPKLLASIANAQWDAMMWGPYLKDRPIYYSCWIDFCLQYSPHMKFYLMDAWPQLSQLDKLPQNEKIFTVELFDQLSTEKNAIFNKLVSELREAYPDKVYIMPTFDAMTLAAQAYLRGELPGVKGINRFIGKNERSLWKDRLGHLGPGFERLEGYVFYATLYGKSPERIKEEIFPVEEYPSPELDKIFRKIAWQAVTNHPLSGVTDKNNDGLAD